MRSDDDLPERISAVLEVVHLVFTTGHTAPVGERLLRQDLMDGAVGLARILHQLLPLDDEVGGLTLATTCRLTAAHELSGPATS